MFYLHRACICNCKETKLRTIILYNETNFFFNRLKNNFLNIFLQIRTMALQTRNLLEGTAVQFLYKISVEYDFSKPLNTATVSRNL